MRAGVSALKISLTIPNFTISSKPEEAERNFKVCFNIGPSGLPQ